MRRNWTFVRTFKENLGLLVPLPMTVAFFIAAAIVITCISVLAFGLSVYQFLIKRGQK